jgi:hypothetical protein
VSWTRFRAGKVRRVAVAMCALLTGCPGPCGDIAETVSFHKSVSPDDIDAGSDCYDLCLSGERLDVERRVGCEMTTVTPDTGERSGEVSCTVVGAWPCL